MDNLCQKPFGFKKCALSAAVSSVIGLFYSPITSAQDALLEEVVVTGIRGSLSRAIDIKRDAAGVVGSIEAEDIGKLPDLNVAE